MKKRIFCLLFLFIIILFGKYEVYGAQVQVVDFVDSWLEGETLEEMQQKLTDISIDSKNIDDTHWTIKTTVTKVGSGYIVGNGENSEEWPFSGSVLYDQGDREDGDSWEVWLSVEIKPTAENTYTFDIPRTYIDDADGEFDPESDWEGQEVVNSVGNGVVDVVSGVVGGIKKAWDFAKDFASNPVGTLCRLICDFFIMIADAFQSLINMFKVEGFANIDYTYQELLENGETGSNNKYTKVGSYGATTSGTQKTIEIDGTRRRVYYG